MKKSLFLFIIIAVLALSMFTACDSENTNITGVYTAENGTLNSFSFTSSTLKLDNGNYTLTLINNGLTLSTTEGNYTFDAKNNTISLDGTNIVLSVGEDGKLTYSGITFITDSGSDTEASPKDTFTIMGKGMLSIFIVMILLYISVKALNYFGNRPNKRAQEDKA